MLPGSASSERSHLRRLGRLGGGLALAALGSWPATLFKANLLAGAAAVAFEVASKLRAVTSHIEQLLHHHLKSHFVR